MANWKKLAVSGSATSFPQLSVDTSITASIFSGSQFIGSLTGTASYASNANIAISSSYALSSSYAVSASYAPGSDTSISASYALSSSYALNASTADSATSASYSATATSASYALTASYVLDKTIVTGSNFIFSQPTPASTWVLNHYLNSQYPVFQVFNASNEVIIPTSITANSNITATITFSVPTAGTAVASIGGFTGSAPTVLSASYADTASFAFTASYALNVPDTASYAITASYALTATSASFAQSGNGTFSGSFSGSFAGDGNGLTNVPASGIVGLQLNQIGSGSVTASIAPDKGFTVNTDTQITGSLSISSSASTFKIEGNGFSQTYLSSNGALVLNPGFGGVGMAGVNQYMTLGYIVGQTAGTQLTGSFTGSFAGTANLPDLTEGTGISAFTYNGSAPATVSVSGSATLTTGLVTKWTGAAFANSSITDSTNVTINNAGGVLVQTGGLYVTGSSTFHDNLTVQGNLTVAGTASFQNTQNLAIADQFILLNSGSTTFQDSGFIVNTGNSGNSGSAFFLETASTTTGTDAQNGRFAVGSGINPDATTATASEYAVTALISGSAPGNAVPQWGGTLAGQGNMWIDTSTDELFIYF